MAAKRKNVQNKAVATQATKEVVKKDPVHPAVMAKKDIVEKKETPKPVVTQTPTEVKPTIKVEKEKTTEVKKPAEKAVTEKKTTKKATKKTTTAKKPAAKKPAAKKASHVAEKVVEQVAPVQAHEKTHVLFVASEAFPFAGTGGLGEVIGSLPAAINNSEDVEARIIIPLYETLPDEDRKKLKFICHINVPLAWRNQYCGLFEYNHNGTIYYFIDNEYYFKRSNLYGYYDDGERFAFLSRAVVELLPCLNWRVDILHCHDWQTALVPIYYKLFYMYREGYGGIKTVFTIHNIEYQGKYAYNIIEDVFGIPKGEYMSIEHHGCINLMKGAIDYSDKISTVSPTYAQEIMTSEYAHDLESVLIKNQHKLVGIINGVNTNEYNPELNHSLFKNYTADSIDLKKVNKRELQSMLDLPVDDNIPVLAMITRLASHKGLDLVRAKIRDLLNNTNIQFVILGKGDADYEDFFSYLQNDYNNRVRSIIAFNKDLSHKIYAGADMFLMPSKSEPCGLSQMMACRYGTIPVVRATGGLKDSIIDCEDGSKGNGFVFYNYDANDMYHAVERAVGLYCDFHDKWDELVQRAIKTDFSWNNSAKKYIDFYKTI